MPTIIPDKTAINWYVQEDRRGGITQIGEMTAVSPRVICITGDSGAALLDAIAARRVSVPDLPDRGLVEENDVYKFGDTLVLVCQSHERFSAASLNAELFVIREPSAIGGN